MTTGLEERRREEKRMVWIFEAEWAEIMIYLDRYIKGNHPCVTWAELSARARSSGVSGEKREWWCVVKVVTEYELGWLEFMQLCLHAPCYIGKRWSVWLYCWTSKAYTLIMLVWFARKNCLLEEQKEREKKGVECVCAWKNIGETGNKEQSREGWKRNNDRTVGRWWCFSYWWCGGGGGSNKMMVWHRNNNKSGQVSAWVQQTKIVFAFQYATRCTFKRFDVHKK